MQCSAPVYGVEVGFVMMSRPGNHQQFSSSFRCGEYYRYFIHAAIEVIFISVSAHSSLFLTSRWNSTSENSKLSHWETTGGVWFTVASNIEVCFSVSSNFEPSLSIVENQKFRNLLWNRDSSSVRCPFRRQRHRKRRQTTKSKIENRPWCNMQSGHSQSSRSQYE